MKEYMFEIIKDRLYWNIVEEQNKGKLITQKNPYVLNVDQMINKIVYNSYFGPVSISNLIYFIRLIAKLLQQNEQLYIQSNFTDVSKSNTALLISSFQFFMLKLTPEQTICFTAQNLNLKPFRDISKNKFCQHTCSAYDCLKGIQKAFQLKWVDYKTFDLKQYQEFSENERGNMNFIVPNKIIAFRGPVEEEFKNIEKFAISPEKTIEILKKNKINLLIRCSTPKYKRELFQEAKINHIDLYFKDGTYPEQDKVDQFIHYVELNKNGLTAVHCKAGLGRTGTLIACHIIKNYGFTVKEAVGWIRMCRPGSILSNQQEFLMKYANNQKKAQVKQSRLQKIIKFIKRICLKRRKIEKNQVINIQEKQNNNNNNEKSINISLEIQNKSYDMCSQLYRF